MTRSHRRKRWITASMAAQTGSRESVPRTIEVWCEERSHDPAHIASLISGRGPGAQETWRPSGPHVTTQRMTMAKHADAPLKGLELLGLVAERHRFVCPLCGLDVVAGDRMGQPGAAAMWELSREMSRMSDMSEAGLDRKVFAASEKTDALLSKVADAGVSRLSLSGLGRIVSL